MASVSIDPDMARRSTASDVDEQEIPKAPPMGLRGRYIKLSWAYVRWCVGMFVWAMACIIYFKRTDQLIEMGIAIGLGVILLAMIFGPAFLFGGETWYKRLGWMVVELCMFSLMWVYPVVAVGLGIIRRAGEGRYSTWPHENDVWHLALSAITIVMASWTFLLTVRVVRIARQLARGEFGEMDIRVREEGK